VPMLQCGLSRLNFSLAMAGLLKQVGQNKTGL
jgi:hypothetical protein